MRKLILISALVLVSATAQAGQSRGLIVASNDERIESMRPDQGSRQAGNGRAQSGNRSYQAGNGGLQAGAEGFKV